MVDKTWLENLPKIELHVHLEGTIPESLILEMAARHEVTLPRKREELLSFQELSDFLELLNWICSLAHSQSEVEDIAYRFAEEATQQNIVYAEVMLNPTHWKNCPMEEALQGALAGFERAYQDGYSDCRLLVSLLRAQTEEESLRVVQWMCENRHPRLIGLSIDGNEAADPDSCRRFRQAFRLAKEAGFGVTVHAGESSGPEGVREALDILNADRIDHGVKAIEDEKLLNRLSGERIPLNICFTSNIGHLYKKETDHPLGELYGMGIPVTVNTDDPKLLHTNLCQELLKTGELYGWDRNDFIRLQENAIAASFCDEDKKNMLRKRLEQFYI